MPFLDRLCRAGAALALAALGHPPPATGADHVQAAALGPRPAPLRSGVLLVAAERLRDPNFARTVVLLAEYAPDGAFGVIIDRPLGIELAALSDLSAAPAPARALAEQVAVYRGGPVDPARVTLIVHAPTPPPDARPVLADVYASASRRMLQWAAENGVPAARVHAYLGYAGWGPGQLDAEFANGDWHLIAATPQAIFSADEEGLWKRLLERARGTWVRRRTPIPHDLPGWLQCAGRDLAPPRERLAGPSWSEDERKRHPEGYHATHHAHR